MPRVLQPDEISRQLSEHQRWKVDSALVATFDCDSFERAIALVNDVARDASDMDHHPDIDVRSDTVVLTLSTHSEGGITQLDIELALRADQAYERLMASS